MKASTVLLLAALGAATAACMTETRIIEESPSPTSPGTAGGDASTDVPPEDGSDAAIPGADGGPTTKDAGGSDAKPPPPPPPPPPNADLGRVHCSASGGAPFYCQAGQVCCVQNAVQQLAPIVLSCETFNGCKARPDPVPLVCDGPEDCKPGESCYAITTPAIALTSLCSTTPISADWKRLCNPGASGECGAGETCVPTTSGPAVGVCR